MYQDADSLNRESELWTGDDAEFWQEAENSPGSEGWMEDDCLLENDLWTESQTGEQLSLSNLRELGIRVS